MRCCGKGGDGPTLLDSPHCSVVRETTPRRSHCSVRPTLWPPMQFRRFHKGRLVRRDSGSTLINHVIGSPEGAVLQREAAPPVVFPGGHGRRLEDASR